jgi:hypothetical protein
MLVDRLISFSNIAKPSTTATPGYRKQPQYQLIIEIGRIAERDELEKCG